MLLASQLLKTTVDLMFRSNFIYFQELFKKNNGCDPFYFLKSSTDFGITPFLSMIGRVTDSDEVPKP